VVREGLRLLEQREREDQAKIEWLRAAAKEDSTISSAAPV
jgi:Arc/MetJ-type ribon-helix-helix transcriptional regulator